MPGAINAADDRLNDIRMEAEAACFKHAAEAGKLMVGHLMQLVT